MHADLSLLLILIIFIVLYLIQTSETLLNEHFQWDPLWIGKTSSNCYEENNKDCLKYSNCGLCGDASQKQCIPGDINGPFYKEGCQRWIYMNYYDRHIFDDKMITNTQSWDAFLPGYEIMYPSPSSAFRL